ncbi:hypothetical protein [Desulfosporosinus nitroreducens]|uniref:hypothetical protein n=1 Tax=Desulfosporosinus nitroreducens TaxID=2018668 RepID=UPI00207CE206|nr:hypothetical protein [Desulfosporosinus nitroreducens]MCO1601779.1 hypothetical protein [Desulfosporosinus nitroreducens]
MFKVRLRRHSRSSKFTKSFSVIEKLFNDVNKSVNISGMESKTRKLGRQILNLLGPDHGLLFLEYEKSIYLAESYCIENAYRLGLKARNGDKK